MSIIIGGSILAGGGAAVAAGRRIITARRRREFLNLADDLRMRAADIANAESLIVRIINNPAFTEWTEDADGRSVHEKLQVLRERLADLEASTKKRASFIDTYVQNATSTAQNVRG